MEVVQRMFALIKMRGIQQKDFAELVGVSPPKVSEWKNGKSKSYTDYLAKIAEVLGVSTDYLLTGEENSPPPEGDELYGNFLDLTPEEREAALAYIAFLKARRQKP